MTDDRLKLLAEHHGLTLNYGEREVPPSTLLTILRGLNQDPDGDVVGPAAQVGLRMPPGAKCYLPDDLLSAPAWGVFCQLYELRSETSWGIGDFSDLANLARILGELGADFLGINPIHALFSADPARTSPFSPSNRKFLNPIYISATELGCDKPAMRESDLVDYPQVIGAKLTALREVFDRFQGCSDFDKFVLGGGTDLQRHAVFETITHNVTSSLHEWPVALRDPTSVAVEELSRNREHEVRFHLWLQWIADRQLKGAQQAALDANMRIGLYLDLAVGEAPDGSATWSGSAVPLPDVTVGAPPDVFSESGQNWNLAAPSPVALRDRNFEPFQRMVEAQLKHSGAIRIDHAMALWQLFLIPSGADGSQGTHLRYPFADLLRVLSEASNGNRSLVIGEDLGFVPDGFRDVMAEAQILSYRIVYFEQGEDGFQKAEDYPELAIACLSTHDLPTLAGWWRGDDISLRKENGLISDEASVLQKDHRDWERQALCKAIGAASCPANAELPSDVLEQAYAFVARTPCVLAGVRLADLVGPDRATNVPGTTDGYPNWQPRSPVMLEDLANHETVEQVSQLMRKMRPRPV